MDRIFSPQVVCCVHGCKSKSSFKTFSQYRLHKFPSRSIRHDGKRLILEWIQAIKLPTKCTPDMRVCSLHFSDDDFIIKGGNKELKPFAVPSKNLPLVWRNKFYPRNHGKLLKLLEFRGIGRLRLCLQAKLVKRLNLRASALSKQRKKSKEALDASRELSSSGKVIETFTLFNEDSQDKSEGNAADELTTEISIKEEPLSDHEEHGDSVEEMLAKMNEESPSTNTNTTKNLEVTFDEEIDPDEEDDFCNVCGSDACTGHGGLLYDCNFCSKSFKTFRQLNAHNLSHFEYTKDELSGGKTKCKVCGEILENVRLSEHMMGHVGANTHICMLCDKKLLSKAALMQHVNSEHTLEKSEQCRLCKKTCSSKIEMDEHIRAHHIMKKEYICRECGVSFRTKSACWAHLNGHSRERIRPGFECEVCNRVLSTKATLKEHMFIHSGEKPFECLLCGKKIRHRANFIFHLRSHSFTNLNSPYACGSCGAQYSRKADLRNHQTQRHPQDIIWYPCIICGVSFKTEAGFTKHAISHNATLDEP